MISYKYKLYKTKHTRHLDNMLSEACFVWNHALSLQKQYYRLYGKYVSSAKMQKHFAKRIKRTYLHSQSVQEVLQRLDTSYTRCLTADTRKIISVWTKGFGYVRNADKSTTVMFMLLKWYFVGASTNWQAMVRPSNHLGLRQLRLSQESHYFSGGSMSRYQPHIRLLPQKYVFYW